MLSRDRFHVTCWLASCAFLVFFMVLLGGAVRLTGSGLSMVDWRPIMGVLPPLNHSAWQQAFLQYQQFPEFILINSQMELSEFKFIYLMEYAHRLLGRLIGLVYFVPFLVFLYLGKLNTNLVSRLWFLFALGAIQGGMGWYMVKSGLVDNPSVSQYRLTAHLIIAVLIYGYMVRIILGLYCSSDLYSKKTRVYGLVLLGAILLMICSGGFVAGTHAGFIYNTFPTMGGTWVPDQVWEASLAWKNLFENPITIQFVHRGFALIILILGVGFSIILFRHANKSVRIYGVIVLIALLLQISLGISTLIMHVPVTLAVAHQACALVLLTSVIVSIFSGYSPLHSDDGQRGF